MPHVIHKENFIALRKADETFVFFYDNDDAEAVIQTMARFAADPELNFNWHDAAVLSRDVALAADVTGMEDEPQSPAESTPRF